MAICYDKHFEAHNRWQNQQIHKHYTNESNTYNYNYYSHSSSKSVKVSPFDIKDHDKAIKSNNIPLWTCSRCTFRNIQRKPLCSMCNLSYKTSKSTASKAKQQNNASTNNEPTLADFCSNIMDEINESIPVWICTQCTYCNIEQKPQCQMCLTPHNKKYLQRNDIYTEQQVIINSVQQKQTVTKQKHKKRVKYTRDTLIKLQKHCEYQSMPDNIINEIPEILSSQFNINTEYKQKEIRARFTMDKLLRLRKDKECVMMARDVINEIPEILSLGLGLSIDNGLDVVMESARVNQRKRFSLEELKSLRFDDGYDMMPTNIIDNASEIFAYGLGTKYLMKD